MNWWTQDPAPRWVSRTAGILIAAMVFAVVTYGLWSYR
jgi:hypothetical protein